MKKILTLILAAVLVSGILFTVPVSAVTSHTQTVDSHAGLTMYYYAGLGESSYPVTPASDLPVNWKTSADVTGWSYVKAYKNDAWFDPFSTLAFSWFATWVAPSDNDGAGPDYSTSTGERGVYLYKNIFNLPEGAYNIQAKAAIGGDNYAWLYLNGNQLLSPRDNSQYDRNFQTPPSTGAIPASYFNVGGENVLAAEIQNGVSIGRNGPTGVVYSIIITYDLNEAPVANDDYYSTPGDTTLVESAPGVLANDTDAEDDTLEASLDSGPSYGTLDFYADGSFAYTPPMYFAGSDSFNYIVSDGQGGTDTATAYIEVTSMHIMIDIKPGSDPNSINLASKGVVPVAVITTDEFDATTVDPASVNFAGAVPLRWAMEDVDGDGDIDLIFHFKTQELELDSDSTEASLTGQITDGVQIVGTDTVKNVPKGKGNGH